jgi:hypothetical protein
MSADVLRAGRTALLTTIATLEWLGLVDRCDVVCAHSDYFPHILIEVKGEVTLATGPELLRDRSISSEACKASKSAGQQALLRRRRRCRVESRTIPSNKQKAPR